MRIKSFLYRLGCVVGSCWFVSLPLFVHADAVPGMASGLPTCQILDCADDTIYDVSITSIGTSQAEELGEMGMVEIDWNWQFAYFEWFLWGDMDANLDYGTIFLTDTEDSQSSSQLVRLALDLGWTWRFPNGLAFQAGVRPGIYSDCEELSGDSFYYPASAAVIYSFSDTVSGLAGVEVRNDFGRGIWPLVQVAWEMAPTCRLRVGFPENRFSVFMGQRVEAYVGCDWRSDSYQITEESSPDLEVVTLEDVRAYGGLGFDISDELTLSLEVGTVMNREIAFNEIDGPVDNDYEIEDATMFRIAVSGPF